MTTLKDLRESQMPNVRQAWQNAPTTMQRVIAKSTMSRLKRKAASRKKASGKRPRKLGGALWSTPYQTGSQIKGFKQ